VARVYVGLGSNVDPEPNLRAAIAELRRAYGELAVSTVYRCRAVGFDGPDFLNLVAAFSTASSPEEVDRRLHEIEARLGRRRSARRFDSRTIDIDLLLYDDLVIERDGLTLPRPEILLHAFVLRPLAELAGDELHPVLERPFAALHRELELEPVTLEPVEVDWIWPPRR
jgi:2-amino-4-hydroxy-6-hydroxymethyldihydropteridine diphosphokinase